MRKQEGLKKHIEIGALLPGEGELAIAIDIFLPGLQRLPVPARVLFCQSGGALDKHYFSLEPEGGDNTFNFAMQMTARGFIVIALDHLGTGASSRPRDGFALTPDVLIAANARAIDEVCAQLRSGELCAALPPLPEFSVVGVGHSMGGMLTAMQQAHYRNFDAVALLGFCTRGLPDYLTPEARAYADNPAGARANIVELARAQGDDPYPQLAIAAGRAGVIYGGGADRRAVAALVDARTNLLAVAGLFSMIPGSTEPDCARIRVPVFLGVGDRDICGDTHTIPASFSGSGDVTLVVLPETGHSHFLFASTTLLYERLETWMNSILAPRMH